MTAFIILGSNLVGAALFAAVLLASGARIRRLLRLPVSPEMRWAVDLMLGAGACGFWVLGLGLAGLLQPIPVTIGVVVQGAIGRWRAVRRPSRTILVAAAAGLVNLILAIGPPHFYDAMVYHLGLPWQALQEGGWRSHPENVFSAFPPLSQLLATPALAWGALRIPALLHWFAWVCAATAAAALARRLGAGRGPAMLLAATVMLLPTAPLVPGFPCAEGWFLAALVPALALAVPGTSKEAALPGVMLLCGLAAAARVQGLTWVVIICVVWALRRRSLGPIVRAVPWFIVGAAPWWAKNLILLGDPIAPMLWRREGLDTLWRDGSVLLNAGMSPFEILARLPIILAPLAPFAAPTLALAALAFAGVRSSRPAISAGLVALFLWAATGALPRFLTPTLVLLLAAGLSWRRRPIARWLGLAVVAGVMVFGAVTQLRWLPLVQPLAIASLPYSDAAPFVAPNPPFAAYLEADSVLPRDARVLVVGESRGFGLPRPFVATSQHDPSPLRHAIEGEASPRLIARELVADGITYLAVNTGEMARLAGSYPITPWKTDRGEARWTELLRSLGPPVVERDSVRIYDLTAMQTLPK